MVDSNYTEINKFSDQYVASSSDDMLTRGSGLNKFSDTYLKFSQYISCFMEAYNQANELSIDSDKMSFFRTLEMSCNIRLMEDLIDPKDLDQLVKMHYIWQVMFKSGVNTLCNINLAREQACENPEDALTEHKVGCHNLIDTVYKISSEYIGEICNQESF